MQKFTTGVLFFLFAMLTPLPFVIGAPVRVAVTPFHWDNDNFLSLEKCSEYTMRFFTGALQTEGVQMIERGEESPMWEELSLSGYQMTLAWDNVDIVIRGRFEPVVRSSVDFFHPYRLKLELIDVTNADILESVVLEKKETGKDDPVRESLQTLAPDLLRKAIARRNLLKESPRFFPIFFTNQSPNGRLDNFELNFKSILTDYLNKRATPFKSLSFGGADDSLEEQTLNWLGFTDIDRSNDWKQIADYFIWGEYSEIESDKPIALDEISINATVHWLARDNTTGHISDKFRVADFEKGVKSLASKIPCARVVLNTSNPDNNAKLVSDRIFERIVPLLEEMIQEILRNDPSIHKSLTSWYGKIENDYVEQLVFASCLFDPGNLKKQYVLLQCGESSENPVLNSRRINRIENWLSNAAKCPIENRMPRAASANLIVERLKASQKYWWFPRGTKEPVPAYHSPDSVTNFIRIMTETTAILGDNNQHDQTSTNFKTNGTTLTKQIRYADSYVSDILDFVNLSKWINPDQKAGILKLAWSLVPESQRTDFLIRNKEAIERLTKEISPQKWGEVQKTQSLVTVPAPVESITKNAGSKSNPTSVNKRLSSTGRRTIVIPGGINAGSLSIPRDIDNEFQREKFVFESMRLVTPSKIAVTGKSENSPRPFESFDLIYDTSNPNSEFRKINFHENLTREIVWSSDGSWGITKSYGEKSTAGSVDKRFTDLFHLIKIAPDGTTIADLSPPDLNLIRNTRFNKFLIEDRSIVLMDFYEKVIYFNICEISKNAWKTMSFKFPELKDNPWYGDQVHSLNSVFQPCGKWVFMCFEKNAALFGIEQNQTYSVDGIYSEIIARNLNRITNELKKEKLSEDMIKNALGAWKFSIDAVSAANGRIFLLHSVGVSSFDPSGLQNEQVDIDHLDFRNQILKLDENGAASWKFQGNSASDVELDDVWVWLAGEYSPRKGNTGIISLINRKNMEYMGAVEFPAVIYGYSDVEMLASGDSVFLIYREPQKEGRRITRFTKEELLRTAAKAINQNQIPHQ